jgi:hypothetical protein
MRSAEGRARDAESKLQEAEARSRTAEARVTALQQQVTELMTKQESPQSRGAGTGAGGEAEGTAAAEISFGGAAKSAAQDLVPATQAAQQQASPSAQPNTVDRTLLLELEVKRQRSDVLQQELDTVQRQLVEARHQVLELNRRLETMQHGSADLVHPAAMQQPAKRNAAGAHSVSMSEMAMLEAELARLRTANQQLRSQVLERDAVTGVAPAGSQLVRSIVPPAEVVLLEADLAGLTQAHELLRKQLAEADRRAVADKERSVLPTQNCIYMVPYLIQLCFQTGHRLASLTAVMYFTDASCGA